MLKDVAKETAKNAAMAVPPLRRWRLSRPRAGAAFTGDDAELQRYAFQTLDVMTQHFGEVRGRSVIEIGPGDLLTSGMALLAAGASHYASVDRFVGDYSRAEGKAWYRGIQDAWPRLYPQYPWPAWLDAATFPESNQDRVSAYDMPIEEVDGQLEPADLVCSFQVGEHISDIDAFARATARLLKPGGAAIHRIDLGPHDVWTNYPDPLTFLRFPGWLWKAMGSQRGTPNRFRAHEFVAAFEAAGLAVEIVEDESFPRDRVDLSKLPRRYRSMPTESLLTQTIYLSARR